MTKRLAATLFWTCLICFTFIMQTKAQNNATLKGTIQDSNQQPLTGANVGLVGESLGASTNAKGKYSINNIPSGTYTLKISFVGYKPQTKKITLKSGQTKVLNVTLELSAEQLA